MDVWVKTYWILCSDSASLTVDLVPTPSLTEEQERTFSERYLRVIKLRKLDPSEDTATKRSCWVYYTRMHALYPMHGAIMEHTLYIIPFGVGWLSCLSRWKGNAKA